jgi:hypothetical protein
MALTNEQQQAEAQRARQAMTENESRRLPVDPASGQALTPRAQPGYYPGYQTLSQQNFWDEATRTLVQKRVEQVPAMRFFSPDEARLMQAILDRILPQDDRDAAHTIPLLPFIDERLYSGRINGYRYDHMPPDADAYRLGLQGVEAIARRLHGRAFFELGPLEQDQVLLTLHDGKPPAGSDIWQRVSVNHFWVMLLQDAVSVYYAHPYAWDEVGYGGPAYPRGYIRLEDGRPEAWEVEERRYNWAPPNTLSGEASREGEHGHDEPHHGASGTH